jgi:hypothetical protein
VLTLIRKARRRLLYNDLLAQFVNAVCAALAAFILLLILGTEILDWYWLLPIPLAAAAVALYRVRKRLPPLYSAAQVVDRRLDLADSLSTAIFFSGQAGAKAPRDLRRWQFEQAERMAAGADVRRAVPFTMPRSVYPMAALLLVASSLFALRYGLTRRLDLGQPMARILADALGFENPQTAKAPERKALRPGEIPQDQNDSPLQVEPQPNDQNQAGDPLEESNDSDTKNAQPSEKNSKEQEPKADSQNGDDQQGQGQERASDDENPNRQNNAKDGQNQQSGGQDSNNSSSSSLLSKMRDAVQNLLSSMKQQPSGANAQQQQQQQNSGQNGKQKGQQNAGKQQQKGEKTNGQAGGEEQDPDLSSESQQAENAPGQGNDAQPSNKQPGGGIGNRDGSKDVKQAEQLAAMGKISQIIGKRSQNLSGEATIEVQSTVQQLRTAYSDRTAQHADAGGEIGRDEIPAALESYVEQYFEQVRKQPAPNAPKK